MTAFCEYDDEVSGPMLDRTRRSAESNWSQWASHSESVSQLFENKMSEREYLNLITGNNRLMEKVT